MGWSNTSRKGSWQPRCQQWHHGKGQWGGSNYNWQQSHVAPSQTAVPNDNTLAQLCGGMLSSAWDGVCSGVASAAWHAVQGTAGAMLKARGVTTASKHDESKSSFDTSAKSLMSCLAGKPAETLTVASQEKPTHHQEGPPSGNDVSNQVLLSYLCWSCKSSSCSCSLCCNNKSCNCRAPKLRCPTLPSHRLR